MRLDAPQFLILALFLALAGACGDNRVDAESGNRPSSTTTLAADPWAEIEDRFLLACTEGDGGLSSAAALGVYCRCAYEETVEFYGTVEALAAAKAEVADDPLAVDPLLQSAFDGCAAAHLN